MMTCDSVMMVEGGDLHLRSAGGTTELVWCVGVTRAYSRQRNLQEYLQAPGGHLHPDATWTGSALQNRFPFIPAPAFETVLFPAALIKS